MNRNIAIILLAAIILSTPAWGRRRTNTTSSRLVRDVPPTTAADADSTLRVVNNPSPDEVAISGYDKQLRSRRESFFVTNAMGADTLHSITVDIVYTDMAGRQLHSRQGVEVATHLPPGETRLYHISSWDRQCSFYYRLSNAPKRAAATPYDVRFTVTGAVVSGRDAVSAGKEAEQ